MSLVLALVLGLILSFRYSDDKISGKNFESQYETEVQKADSFICKYAAPYHEMSRVKQMIETADSDIADFSRELCEIIGMAPTPPMILWGFLAKQGQLPDSLYVRRWDSDNPLSNNHDLIWGEVTGWKHLDIQKMRDARLKFLLWYDKELRSHGVSEELLYIPAHYTLVGKKQWARYDPDYYYLKDAKPISECHNLQDKITNAYVVREKNINAADSFPVMVCWKSIAIYAPHVLGIHKFLY